MMIHFDLTWGINERQVADEHCHKWVCFHPMNSIGLHTILIINVESYFPFQEFLYTNQPTNK